MNLGETTPRAGAILTRVEVKSNSPQVPGVREALTGFVQDFKAMQADLHDRMQQQEERIIMLDRKTLINSATKSVRPALSGAVSQDAPHQKAFEAYVRSGDDDALRGLAMEEKAMTGAVAADGGYLVDPQTADAVKTVMRNMASLRGIAQVVTVEAVSYDVLVDHTDIGSGWPMRHRR